MNKFSPDSKWITRSQFGILFLLTTWLFSCGQGRIHDFPKPASNHLDKQVENNSNFREVSIGLDTATLAAGCFWCVEEQFKQLEGVSEVISGYTGGSTTNPSYKQVLTGKTGHAEACRIVYDPSVISYDELLAAFFVSHDPTELNRQGNDIGTQYRSAIFYHNNKQKELAEFYRQKLNDEEAYPKDIVTEISPFTVFYKAEDYHQDYYRNNPDEAYCRLVIKPKLEKFREVFKDKLKQL